MHYNPWITFIACHITEQRKHCCMQTVSNLYIFQWFDTTAISIAGNYYLRCLDTPIGSDMFASKNNRYIYI